MKIAYLSKEDWQNVRKKRRFNIVINLIQKLLIPVVLKESATFKVRVPPMLVRMYK